MSELLKGKLNKKISWVTLLKKATQHNVDSGPNVTRYLCYQNKNRLSWQKLSTLFTIWARFFKTFCNDTCKLCGLFSNPPFLLNSLLVNQCDIRFNKLKPQDFNS